MAYPFFRPREIHAEALLLVGYRLYPYVHVELHPRLTLLAGGNGAGKTTLLDAIQTVLIADQRYLHLNVAAGQNDRDIGGQLQGRTAWAVLQLTGHQEVGAIGVHIARRAAVEYVDLRPFVLIGCTPEKELFLNRETSRITQDLKSLNQLLAQRLPGARAKEFSTVNEYHRFLYEEGLFPIDLSRGGRKLFSLLWRQATQPHLGELNSFLQKTLCHEPEKRLTFEDVEKLMQERLHAERQLRRLAELKSLVSELQGMAHELDYHRRRFLATNLAQAKQKEESLQKEIEEKEVGFRELEQQIKEKKSELDTLRSRLAEIDRERDRYIREQGDWSRKYKHYQEYVAHRRLFDNLQEEINWALEEIYPLETALQAVREKSESTRWSIQAVSSDIKRLREKESELDRRVKRWQDFKKDLERASAALGSEILSPADLESTWSRMTEERRKIQELKPLKQLLAQWEQRAKAHEEAAEAARKMVDTWVEFFDGKPLSRELLEQAQSELRDLERSIALRRRELRDAQAPLQALIDELSKGRLPLPAAAGNLVESAKALPFIRHFDALDLETARKCQETIGPLAYAIEPMPEDANPLTMEGGSEPRKPQSEITGKELPPRLAELASGSEPFLLVLSPEAWKECSIIERTEEGTIARYGSVAWYTPKGRVWIGAEARREQIRRAQEEILRNETELQALTLQEGILSKRQRTIQGFLTKLEAFLDAEAPQKAGELARWVEEQELRAPQVERIYPLLQKLFQRSELFHFTEAPDQLERLQIELDEKNHELSRLDEDLRSLKKKEKELHQELDEYNEKYRALEKDFERVKTICSRLEEEEAPEVLQGRVDFGRAEELARRVEEIDAEKRGIQTSLLLGEREHGEQRNRYRTQGEAIAKLGQDLVRQRNNHSQALDLWKQFYPADAPQYILPSDMNEREQHRTMWESTIQLLRAKVQQVAERYELKLPEGTQPDELVSDLLQLLLPPGVELTQLESQYSRLQYELQQIENKIKGHVEEIRSSVEGEIRRLRMHIAKVNRILSTLNFGNIKRISLELEELPAYHALKRLESFVRIVTRGEAVTLREFIEKLRAFILEESNTTLTEEQIADYRSYIRIRRIIIDADDRMREGGLSSGETLGVNLALCLSILFFIGREHGIKNGTGMLLLALDEAERLDARALETIRGILDDVRCQLTVAMPRPVNIPDSVCHILTPLSQGVTHVHLYYRGSNGNERTATEHHHPPTADNA